MTMKNDINNNNLCVSYAINSDYFDYPLLQNNKAIYNIEMAEASEVTST